jgi:serine/threonine protein kinase
LVPSIISHYEILEKLGEGGMGVVYRAEDTRLGRTVALKFLPDHLTADEAERGRFLQEAKAAAALNHKNICTVYGIEEHDGQMFISMEYIEGGTLRQKLPYAKAEDAIATAIQIGEALQEAHSMGVVHSDIKADNIMLTSKGQIKVMDFGLAKLKGAMKLTRTSNAVGTPAYMAPEQIQGGEVDFRSDIFSYGVLLYEMLAGRLPFRGEHDASVMYSIVHEDPPSLSLLRTDVPDQLEGIILRALEKDVNKRYQDVHTMLGLLKEVNIRPSHPSQHLLAVLPFDNISPDKEIDYFTEGLTEEIIASLSKLRGLKVISRTSVMRYKGEEKNLKQIAGELHATYVLEGSVRTSGQELRITTQLIDADQDISLWSETYRGNLNDVFDIQEKVAGRILRALKVRLTPDEKKRLRKRFTEDKEAYQLYLQGRHFWNKRTEVGLNAAIRYFEKAIEKDSRYSLAWSGVADSYNLLATYGEVHRKDLYKKAKAAVTKALDIDDRLAEAHTSLAMLLMLDEWDWTNSEKEFKLGISLQPHYATAHHWYAEWLIYMGQLDAALLEISRAVELDPVSPAIFKDKGLVHYYSRQYDKAIEMAMKALELDPAFGTVHRLLSLAYQGKHMFDEAIAENSQWQLLTGHEFEAKLALAQLHAASGRKEEAREVCGRLELDLPQNGLIFRGLALVYAALGENDVAFKLLENAYESRDESMCTLKVDPKMDNLRPDPRFNSLIRRIGLER